MGQVENAEAQLQIVLDNASFAHIKSNEEDRAALLDIIKAYIDAGMYNPEQSALTLLGSNLPATVENDCVIHTIHPNGKHLHLMAHLSIKAGWGGSAEEFAQEAIGVEAYGWIQGIKMTKGHESMYLVECETY